MPSFHQSGDIQFATIITGPRHCRLGLELSTTPVVPTLIELPAIGNCDHGRWDLGRLEEAVAHGLTQVADRHGVILFAKSIHYVTDDTPSLDMASRCAYLIGERFARSLESGEDTV